MIKRKFHSFLFISLILLPPALIVHLIQAYGITTPWWDQWEFVPLLEKAHAGGLTFADIWKQHNEHRLVFPKLIMLFFALLTGWDIRYELYASLFIAGATLTFLYLLLYKASANRNSMWLMISFSFLIFSPAQWENWILGWQIALFLNVLGYVIAVWAVCRWPAQFRGILVAAGAATLSTLSFSSGLLVWIVIGILLMMQGRRRQDIILWTVSSIAVWCLYFLGYTNMGDHPSILSLFSHPFDLIQYVLVYLGAPIAFGNMKAALCIGLLSVIALCAVSIRIYYIDRSAKDELFLWITFACYPILSAFATGIGRVGFGVNQALSSRYIVFSTLFLISLLALIRLWLRNYVKQLEQCKGSLIIFVIVTSMISLSFISCYALSFSHGRMRMNMLWREVEEVKGWVFENVDAVPDEWLQTLHWSPEVLRERTKTLLKLGIIKVTDWQQLKRISGGSANIELINGQIYPKLKERAEINRSKDINLTVAGWAIDKDSRDSGKKVYIVLKRDGHQIIIPAKRERRPDISEYYKEKGYLGSGWVAFSNLDSFKNGCYDLSLRIIRVGKDEYYEMDGNTPICFYSLKGEDR